MIVGFLLAYYYVANTGVTVTTNQVNIANTVADAAIVVSLVFLGYQILMQRVELRYDTYERLMDKYADSAVFLATHPEIEKYLPSHNLDASSESDQKLTAYYYLDVLLALFERVWIARTQKRMRMESWLLWRRWIQDLARNEMFVVHFKSSENYYSASFTKEVNSIISGVSAARTES